MNCIFCTWQHDFTKKFIKHKCNTLLLISMAYSHLLFIFPFSKGKCGVAELRWIECLFSRTLGTNKLFIWLISSALRTDHVPWDFNTLHGLTVTQTEWVPVYYAKVPPMRKCTYLKRNAFRNPVSCDLNAIAFHGCEDNSQEMKRKCVSWPYTKTHW